MLQRIRLAVLVTALTACPQAAKDISGGIQLVACVDNAISNNLTIEQAIAKCGPDAAQEIQNIFASRQAYLAKRNAPCTTVVLDAGLPDGPGR